MTTRTKIYIGAAGAALLLVILLVVGFFVVRSAMRNSRVAPFRAHMDEYLGGPRGTPGTDKIRGKLLPIDEKAKDVDPLYFDLPSDLVAQTPEEVGTVVRFKWATQPVATYKGGATANQDFCLLDVFDVASGQTHGGVIRIEGRMPQVRGGPEVTDTRSLHTKVIEFLTKLKPGANVEDVRPK